MSCDLYISLLQTLFLGKSVSTLTSLLVTLPNLTVKKSTKMKISANKIHVFYNFSLGNPKGPKIWNSLPKNVISITSVSRFKKRTD